jgi:hypothetical protein
LSCSRLPPPITPREVASAIKALRPEAMGAFRPPQVAMRSVEASWTEIAVDACLYDALYGLGVKVSDA